MGIHEELLAPSMGLAPDGASLRLFKIVPDDFVEPARNTAMASAAGFKTCSQALLNWLISQEWVPFVNKEEWSAISSALAGGLPA
jgi:hypothetical protein